MESLKFVFFVILFHVTFFSFLRSLNEKRKEVADGKFDFFQKICQKKALKFKFCGVLNI